MIVAVSRPQNTRKARVARLVYMLATGQIVRTADLCARFSVSRRTIARYIADVRDAGFDVGYSELEDTYRLNRVCFAPFDAGVAGLAQPDRPHPPLKRRSANRVQVSMSKRQK